MKTFKHVYITIFVIIGTLFLSGCTHKVNLILKLKQGKSYNITITNNQHISQAIQDVTYEIDQTTTIEYTFDVKEVDPNDNAFVRVTYQSVHFNIKGATDEIEYDSSNPPEEVPPLMKGFAAIVGESFDVQITPKGAIMKVTGLESFIQRMMDKIDLPYGSQRDIIEKNLAENYGEKAVQEMLENMLKVFADKSVKVGQSWEKKIEMRKTIPMIIESTYTLRELSSDIAYIDIESLLKPNPVTLPDRSGLMQFIYDISGTQKGTLEIELDSGLIRHAQFNQKMSGDVRVAGTKGMPQSMSWPVKISSVISIDSVRK